MWNCLRKERTYSLCKSFKRFVQGIPSDPMVSFFSPCGMDLICTNVLPAILPVCQDLKEGSTAHIPANDVYSQIVT